jgi:hypothetical protein
MSYLHKTHNRFIRFLGLITIAVFGMLSTLGTGGSDGDGDGVPPVTYTGLRTPAAITSDNALLFGEIAFLGLSASTTITPIAVQSVPPAETRNASVITITRVLHAVVNDINVNSAINSIPMGWVETQPPISGDCSSGTASGSIDVNESTQMFSGSLVFNNFCDFGITMDGTVDIVGTCDPNTFNVNTQTCDIIAYTLTFNTLNVSGYGVSETMDGTISSVITSPTDYQTTLNILLRDDNDNMTYWFENYVITVTYDLNTGYDNVVVTGNVYHPAYGFVVISTLTPVEFNHDMLDSPPLSGVARLTGGIPTGADPMTSALTTATFRFIDFNNFEIDLDTDGVVGTDRTLSCAWDTGICF